MNTPKSATMFGFLVLVQVALTFLLFIVAAGAATTGSAERENICAAIAPEVLNEEIVKQSAYREGPHQELDCVRCHKEKPEEQQPAGESVADDSIRLCRSCHPVEHLHPVGHAAQPAGKQEICLPLGKGSLRGLIVCYTCHTIHRYENNPFLLRGQSLTDSGGRKALCLHCHPDRFTGKFPHTGEESSCGLCHVSRPQKRESPAAPPDPNMQAVCQLCHWFLPDAHFDGVNPFVDAVVRQRAEEAGNFFAAGREVCTTCHDPHGRKNGRYLLRADYLEVCEDSRALDPHWNAYLCLSCHLVVSPVKGNAPLREGGDKVKLCNRCHHSEYARPDIHPVGVSPSQHIRLPEDMPLHEKKLTCETCHNSLLQMGCPQFDEAATTNPNFLRKVTVSRNEFCFLCHIEETYKRLNPHTQLNEQGDIVQDTCLFCHASLPDVSFMGPEKVSFIVQDPNEYCIGCHPGFTRNHPAGENHLLEPTGKILAAIQSSVERIGVELPLFKGRIVCATCHNPHQEGVIKIAAAATGTERENKLRLKPGRNQCTGCHWDK